MATVEALDVEAARARFAALERPVSFLDGPGGSQVPREVVDAISGYLVRARTPTWAARSRRAGSPTR